MRVLSPLLRETEESQRTEEVGWCGTEGFETGRCHCCSCITGQPDFKIYLWDSLLEFVGAGAASPRMVLGGSRCWIGIYPARKLPWKGKLIRSALGLLLGSRIPERAGSWLGSLTVTPAMGRRLCRKPPRLSPAMGSRLRQSGRVYPSRCLPWQEVRGGTNRRPRG